MNYSTATQLVNTDVNLLPADVSFGGAELPFTIRAAGKGSKLSDWVKEHKILIDHLLVTYGALRFTGFNVDNAEKLRQVALSHAPELLSYIERGAPRNELVEGVFTSTEYAKEHAIPLHHEMSYSHNWPCHLYFSCEKAAKTGGFTPIADDRVIFSKLPSDIKREFIDKKVMYVRNFGLGVDMGWQEAFQTSDKKEVERYLTQSKTEFEWRDDDVLRTKSIRQAVMQHPVSGESVWFNHAHLFHSSNMPQDIREFLVEEFTEEGMPRNAYFGDGSKIDDEIVNVIRGLYEEHAVTFDWLEGDVLFLDNFLVTHGRSPFEGERKVCVAMANLFTNDELV